MVCRCVFRCGCDGGLGQSLLNQSQCTMQLLLHTTKSPQFIIILKYRRIIWNIIWKVWKLTLSSYISVWAWYKTKMIRISCAKLTSSSRDTKTGRLEDINSLWSPTSERWRRDRSVSHKWQFWHWRNLKGASGVKLSWSKRGQVESRGVGSSLEESGWVESGQDESSWAEQCWVAPGWVDGSWVRFSRVESSHFDWSQVESCQVGLMGVESGWVELKPAVEMRH